MEASSRLTVAGLPLWTLAICAIAGAVYLSPFLGSVLIYDRSAIADGELWRLATGNLVHYSSAHLGYDLLAMLVVGAMIESSGYRHYPMLCFVSAACIGVVLYWSEPSMHYYAGLSGVATAGIVYLSLHGLNETGPWRWVCVVALMVVGAKTGFEYMYDHSPVIAAGSGDFLPMPLSHVVGAACALALFVLPGRANTRRAACRETSRVSGK